MLTAARVPKDLADAPLLFDRRAARREPQAASAMAALYDAAGDVSLSPVKVVDAGRGGLGLLSPLPAAPGSRVTLYGDELPAPHMNATVVRCERAGKQFRLGVRCDARIAA